MPEDSTEIMLMADSKPSDLCTKVSPDTIVGPSDLEPDLPMSRFCGWGRREALKVVTTNRLAKRSPELMLIPSLLCTWTRVPVQSLVQAMPGTSVSATIQCILITMPCLQVLPLTSCTKPLSCRTRAKNASAARPWQLEGRKRILPAIHFSATSVTLYKKP